MLKALEKKTKDISEKGIQNNTVKDQAVITETRKQLRQKEHHITFWLKIFQSKVSLLTVAISYQHRIIQMHVLLPE